MLKLVFGIALWLVCAVPAVAQEQNAPGPEKPIGEAPEERNAEDIFLRGQRVLLGRGEVVLDVGQFFSRTDTLQLAVAENVLRLATREQSALTTVLFGRIGVLTETEVFAGAAIAAVRIVNIEKPESTKSLI